MLEILNGTSESIQKNIEILAKDYFEKTGRTVCRTCPSDIQYMISSLKNIYKMTNFKFRNYAAQYKNAKGDRTTISNNTMTDAKAIEFLKTNPKRIELFSEYPSNWKKLIEGKAETAEQLEARLAIEAEIAIANKAKAEVKAEAGEGSEGDEETDEERIERQNAEGEAAAIAAAFGGAGSEAEEETEAKAEDISKMTLKELREKYPEIKATSIKAFVAKVLSI